MSHTTEATRKLIQIFKEKIPLLQGKNLFYTTDVDYSENGINIATQPPLPSVHLVGPVHERNALFTTQEKPSIRLPDGKFRTYNAEEAVDLSFQVIALADTVQSLTALTESIHAFLLNGKSIVVERNPGTQADGTVKYEIDLTDKFVFGRMVNKSNLKEATGRVIIRGVLISDNEVFQEGFVAEEVNVTAKTL